MPQGGGAARPLHSRTFGSGPARVLALHCGLGHGGMWRAVASALGGAAQVEAPDLPGHGRSAPFPEGCDVQEAALAACRPLLVPGSHLVGHSFGATVALRLALAAPRAIASLTLVEPVFFAAARGCPEFVAHRAAEEVYFAACARGDTQTGARQFNRLWGAAPWDSLPAKARQDMAAGMRFVVATEPSLWQDCHGVLAPGRLETLTCPVTFIRGTETLPIIAAVHRGLRARLPRATETVIPGAGHMLTMTHAAEVAARLREHLGSPATALDSRRSSLV